MFFIAKGSRIISDVNASVLSFNINVAFFISAMSISPTFIAAKFISISIMSLSFVFASMYFGLSMKFITNSCSCSSRSI